jgi:hypothetical protein
MPLPFVGQVANLRRIGNPPSSSHAKSPKARYGLQPTWLQPAFNPTIPGSAGDLVAGFPPS